MQQLFAVWENKWREWIVPHPFAKYPDPMPDFEGSAFCIEQYALGMALEELMQVRARRTLLAWVLCGRMGSCMSGGLTGCGAGWLSSLGW